MNVFFNLYSYICLVVLFLIFSFWYSVRDIKEDNQNQSYSWSKKYILSKNDEIQFCNYPVGCKEFDFSINDDNFGSSLSIKGDTFVVGAHGDDGEGLDRGAVYIFEKNTNGTWEKKYKISNNSVDEECSKGFECIFIVLEDESHFGLNLAIDKKTLAVTDKYVIYIFEKQDNTWRNKQIINLPVDKIEIDGETLVATDSNKTYIFEKQENTWKKEQTINVSGFAIAIDKSILFIGDKVFKKKGKIWKRSLKVSFKRFGIGNIDVALNKNSSLKDFHLIDDSIFTFVEVVPGPCRSSGLSTCLILPFLEVYEFEKINNEWKNPVGIYEVGYISAFEKDTIISSSGGEVRIYERKKRQN